MKGHLGWLVEKGHIVQYFNGLLALPEAHPKFRNLPTKKDDSAADVAAENAAAPVEAPAAETAAPAEEAPAAEEVKTEPITEEEKKEEVSNEVADKLAE
jgi:hypothetical protein